MTNTMAITQIEKILYPAKAHNTVDGTEEPREPPTDAWT